ncbi:type II toxin-antitoxin system HigB family toxin [uncultured Mucilaginibacter sp.]|uniref:type II toxin-antitoxin system HigB family toxin n=1 Tax=uncultured Mucilaginibacter sp. TaxID=797541 RepID=UPI0025D7A615|nr:type II toxin-antitoxin system HigB family toxin [uncultured Mucilaginibacter sp.]
MVIITKGVIHLFAAKYPRAAVPLNEWFDKCKRADWKNFTEVKQYFNSIDAIGNDRYVFDIGGNNYRLIAMIHFDIRTLYIRGIFTHAEYDDLNKRGKLNQL